MLLYVVLEGVDKQGILSFKFKDLFFLSVPDISAYLLYLLPYWNLFWIPVAYPVPNVSDHLIQACLPIHAPACKINQERAFFLACYVSIHIFILPHDLSSLSCLCTLDFPSWMWLICLVPCGSARIVGTHTVCCVMYLPSSGLWCFSQGWQRFYQLTSFIMWPHGHRSRSCVSQSFPGASKVLQSTLRCLSNAFQFMPGALQYFPARSCVTLLPSAQAPACSLWCVCLTHAWNMSFFCWWLNFKRCKSATFTQSFCWTGPFMVKSLGH